MKMILANNTDGSTKDTTIVLQINLFHLLASISVIEISMKSLVWVR